MSEEKTWVEVSSANLLHNLRQFRQRVGDKTKICGVVKSNAYGHDLKLIAKEIEPYIDFFAVDSITEALQLKEQGTNKPILILGFTLHDNLPEVINNDFHQIITNYETLLAILQNAEKMTKPANIHLKIETGTSRQGIFPRDMDKYLTLIKNNHLLNLAGVSTHYANIEDTTDHSFAFNQLEIYKKAVQKIQVQGFTNFIKHTACSAAAVLYPQSYFDMVRLGISLYGYWSSPQTMAVAKQNNIKIELKPALTWKTKIAHLKTLPAGSCISYGCTEKVEEPTTIAVLPVGYWDGFDRKLSSLGNVLIQGKRCKIMGRVCMNMTVVNVNHLDNPKIEDEVVLLGTQNNQKITAEELADQINTINYEVVTKINPLIKRILI